MNNNKQTYQNISKLYNLPFIQLLYQAQTTHQQYFNADEIQLSWLLSIKTGLCPENCAYCPQSAHYNVDINKEKLLPIEQVIKQASNAKVNGASRFCMGGAWRSPPKKALDKITEMIKAVKAIGLETCVTLGMLDAQQARQLKQAGLDFYNHNLDTSPKHYQKIITTHTYQDRLNTLKHVSDAGISVCCGGIIGMGETRDDRIEFLMQLANLEKHPESVPINRLIAVKGTPLENTKQIENIEFIKTIAVARLLMPKSVIRLTAGRETMSDEMQALCFFAGANSIFIGDKLLTENNAELNRDLVMLEKLGMKVNLESAVES